MGLEYRPQLNLAKMAHISFLAYKLASITDYQITSLKPTSVDLDQAQRMFDLHVDKNYKENGN